MEHSHFEDLRNRALITFSYDDGKRDNYDIALPIHEEYGINASFAIIADRAVNPKHWDAFMNPSQIVDASRRGVEITSHGVMHKKKFTELDTNELDFELKESKRILNGFLPDNQEVDTLCIPFSATNEFVLSRAYENYSLVRGLGWRNNEPISDNGFVASHALVNTTKFYEIKKKIDEAVKREKWIVLMLHGVVDDKQAEGLYDISKDLLRRILEYVTELGAEKIRPVTFADVARLRKQGPPAKQIYRPNITQSGAYTLADAPGYLITYHKNQEPNDKVVISFGGLPSRKAPEGFGSSFIQGLGYDHIYVAQAAGTQYQQLPLSDFVDAVKTVIEGKDVFTYGSSLGAYAALYYGGAINASIIASAPKNSAHPSMLKKRFSHIEFMHDDLVNVPKSQVQPLILFDPFRAEETQFIREWVTPAYPDAYLIKVPFAGHLVLEAMKESGVLRDFITSYIEDGDIIPFELVKTGSYTWHREKGHRLRSKYHYAEAKEHYRASIKIRQTGEAVAGLARILIRENQAEAANEVVANYYSATGGYKDVPLALRQQIEQKLREG